MCSHAIKCLNLWVCVNLHRFENCFKTLHDVVLWSGPAFARCGVTITVAIRRGIIWFSLDDERWLKQKVRNNGASECYKNNGTTKDMCEIYFYYSVAYYYNHATFSL